MSSQFVPFSNGNAINQLTSSSKLSFDETLNSLVLKTTGSPIGDASAALLIDSIEQGIGLSQMSTVERNAILTPREGLLVYDTTIDAMFLYANSGWEQIGALFNYSVSLDFSGIWASPQSGTVTAKREGNYVRLSLPPISDTATTPSLITSTALPAALFPVTDKYILFAGIEDDSILSTGVIKIDTSGILTIGLAIIGMTTLNFQGNYSGTGTSGFTSFIVNYDISN